MPTSIHYIMLYATSSSIQLPAKRYRMREGDAYHLTLDIWVVGPIFLTQKVLLHLLSLADINWSNS